MVSPCLLNIRLTTLDATCCSAVVGGTVRGLERMSVIDMTSALLPSPHFVAAFSNHQLEPFVYRPSRRLKLHLGPSSTTLSVGGPLVDASHSSVPYITTALATGFPSWTTLTTDPAVGFFGLILFEEDWQYCW